MTSRLPGDSVARRRLAALGAKSGSTVYWPLLGLLAVFGATAFIVPILTPVSVNDDWVYSRSVEILMRQGSLAPLDVSSAVYTFQTLWGGLFAWILGDELGIFRLSTFALVIISAPALYGICRELGSSRHQALLGTAIYLFNPILFALAFSFMTDPHYIALMVISAYFYVRGVPTNRGHLIVAGSAVASCAFMVRQHAILVPLAVGTYLLFRKKLSFNPRSARLVAQILGIPAITVISYFVWLNVAVGVPGGTDVMVKGFIEAPWDERVILFSRMAFITLMYLGLFMLPLAIAAVPRTVKSIRSLTRQSVLQIGFGVAILIGGVVGFSSEGRFMPLVPNIFSREGIGPSDLLPNVRRPPIVPTGALIALTALVALSALICVVVMIGKPKSLGPAEEEPETKDPRSMGAGLVLSIALWQAVALFIVSHWFRGNEISLDRYIVVLLPLAVPLLLRRMRDLTFSVRSAWVVVAVSALFSVAGTRDLLVFHRTVWDFGDEALEMGIPLTKLDAGAGWDGYHASDGEYRAPSPKTFEEPWWIPLFAPEVDSTYVISTLPLKGYSVISSRPYSLWLQTNPAYLRLYLSERVQPNAERGLNVPAQE